MSEIKAPDLAVNTVISANAPDSQLVVTVDQNNRLKPGVYVFQLVVVDDANNSSQPTTFRVVVVDDAAPTAVIDGPASVSLGKPIVLSGKRSVDIGGAVAKYIWTLVSAP